MKLRIRGNSLRLRLLRGEVERFGKTGIIAETINFGASPETQLSYVLESNGEAQTIAARFDGNRIRVEIPAALVKRWTESDEVSLHNEQAIGSADSGNFLKILIEKDFVCLDRKNDPDNDDAFPHPTGKCG